MLHPQSCRLHIGEQRIERLALSDYLRAALRTLEQLLITWGLAQAGWGR